MKILRFCLSDTGKLPEILVGCSIEIKTKGRGSLIRTVVEILHRDTDYVLVRDSDKG